MTFTPTEIKLYEEVHKSTEDISREEVDYLLAQSENPDVLSEREMDILKLRLFEGKKYTEIVKIRPDTKYPSNVRTIYLRAIHKVRRSCSKSMRVNDGSPRIKDEFKGDRRRAVTRLANIGIYTLRQLADYIEQNGGLTEVEGIDTTLQAYIIFYLENDGYNVRRYVSDEDTKFVLAELDRRDYIHVRQVLEMLETAKHITKVDWIDKKYMIGSKCEYGVFNINLVDHDDYVKVRLTCDSTADRYQLGFDINSVDISNGLVCESKTTHEIETTYDMLTDAIEYLSLASMTSLEKLGE